MMFAPNLELSKMLKNEDVNNKTKGLKQQKTDLPKEPPHPNLPTHIHEKTKTNKLNESAIPKFPKSKLVNSRNTTFDNAENRTFEQSDNEDTESLKKRAFAN
jgi:hypothetical protein